MLGETTHTSLVKVGSDGNALAKVLAVRPTRLAADETAGHLPVPAHADGPDHHPGDGEAILELS